MQKQAKQIIKKNKKTNKIIIPLSPIGILEKFNYYSKDPKQKRIKCLNKMIKKHKYKDIISRLNATAIRFKNKIPVITKNIKHDMLYLKKKYRPDLYKKLTKLIKNKSNKNKSKK